MLPDPAVLAPFTLATLAITLTPGPDMTFFVGRAISQGRAAGLAALAGAFSGVLVHTMLVAFGLSALVVAAPAAFLALKIAGAVYLAWLAVEAIRHGSAFALPGTPPTRASLRATWASGLAINLLNPKILLFFMTFLPQFVAPGDPDAAGKLITLGLLFMAIALVVTLPIVLAADRVAVLLRRRPRIARAIDWAFAGIFATFAVQILLGRGR